MLRGKNYVKRVFDNNFRGDFVAEVKKKGRSSRRNSSKIISNNTNKLIELTKAKISVNPIFIMRLEADKIDISFYEEQAKLHNIPLTSGIGSPQIDRNSIENLDATKIQIRKESRSFIESIKRVSETIDLPQDNHVRESWPSHIYFEDINGQSQFELVEIILDEVYKSKPVTRKK